MLVSHEEVAWGKLSNDIGSKNFAPKILGANKDVAYLVTQSLVCGAGDEAGLMR